MNINLSAATLNIDHWQAMLTVQALNRCENIAQAAEELGITVRTLWSYKRRYNIRRAHPRNGSSYYIDEKRKG